MLLDAPLAELRQSGHARLGQPHGFAMEAAFLPDAAILGLPEQPFSSLPGSNFHQIGRLPLPGQVSKHGVEQRIAVLIRTSSPSTRSPIRRPITRAGAGR
jgi:hypothetical protein